MRTNPHILEVNTQVWLNDLSNKLGKKITLAEIPESYINRIKERGFDAVWLMGVWQHSPESKQIAQNLPSLNEYLSKILPDYKKEYIGASPYAIYDYKIDASFGGEIALAKFRQKLNNLGIKLILDFAGNHLSCDTPYMFSNPEYFITKKEVSEQEKGLFFQAKNGLWYAHGRDPHYEPWTDTAQLNYAKEETRQFLLNLLKKITSMCDGLRCDMVMLMLNKVFSDTWSKYIDKMCPLQEFWEQAVKQIKRENPYFILLAEVYWGLEWDIQELGFDYTYDKTLYDRLVLSNAQDIQGHLNAEHLYQMRSLRFIANHDEQSPLKAFGREKSKAAAVACYTLTGARLFTLSQLYGAKDKYPIQYQFSSIEPDKDILSFYQNLLRITNHPCFHGGQWAQKNALSINNNNTSNKNILVWLWVQSTTCKLVLINYDNYQAQFKLNMDKFPKTEVDTFYMTEQLKNKPLTIEIAKAKKEGIYFEMQPYEVRIYSFNF